MIRRDSISSSSERPVVGFQGILEVREGLADQQRFALPVVAQEFTGGQAAE